MSAITGLDIIYGDDTKVPSGYHKIFADLNKGARGEFIYLCYSTTASGSPITNVQVFASGTSEFTIQDGYERINKDVNKGAKGKFIYVCYTRNKIFPPITEVNVIQGPVREIYPPSAWVRINQDCSEGAGEDSDYTYITYRYK